MIDVTHLGEALISRLINDSNAVNQMLVPQHFCSPSSLLVRQSMEMKKLDGHGGLRRYFSVRSQKEMEKKLGHHFIRENKKYLRAYRVESIIDGTIITSGWLHDKYLCKHT